jgi:hypothetical protein
MAGLQFDGPSQGGHAGLITVVPVVYPADVPIGLDKGRIELDRLLKVRLRLLPVTGLDTGTSPPVPGINAAG